MLRKPFAWIVSIILLVPLAGQTANRAHAGGEEYRVLAAHCKTPEGTATALVLLHRLFEDDWQTLAAMARGAVRLIPGCSPVGDDGFIALDEAQKAAGVALPKPTLILALLPGPIVDFGPTLTLNDGGKEKYEWAVGYGGQSGERKNILSPISAILAGSWRCFNVPRAPVSRGIIAHDTQTCDFDQSAGLFIHWTVYAQVFSIEDGSVFFGDEATARRALVGEMKQLLTDWLKYQPE